MAFLLKRAGLAALILGFAASAARASDTKSYIELALTKTDEISQTDQGKAEHALTALDLAGGFGVGSGVILGLKYFDFGIDDKIDGEATSTIKGYGPMIGYLHPSLFFANATYLVQPTKDIKDASGGDTTYAGGSGYVISIGKAFEVTKTFGLGIQLTQAHVSYKNVTDPDGNQSTLHGSWYDQMLHPYIGAFVFF